MIHNQNLTSYINVIHKKYGTPCCLAPYVKRYDWICDWLHRDLKGYGCVDCFKFYSLNEIEENRKTVDRLNE
jgi:hypothetical protein